MFHIYADGKTISQPFARELTVLSPKLVLELGKAGSFEFSLPWCHKYYYALKKLKSIITVKMDDTELFRGRILSHERVFNNVKKVYAEGCLAYLVDTVQKNEKYEGTTHDLFRKIVAEHNAQTDPEKRFEVGDIGIEDREIVIAGTSEEYQDLETGRFDYKQIAINSISKERMTSLDYIESNIIEYCGGYLRTRSENGVTYLDLLGREGVEAPQPIRFGINMLDLTEEATAEDVFSVLIPIGDENLTIAKVNGGSEELVDEETLALFGRIVKAHVFDSVKDPRILMENGLRFIENHENMPITFTIKAFDMHMVDPNVKEIHLGESVLVKSRPHNLDLRLICTRIEYDLEKPENTTYTFGNQKQTLTQRYQKDKYESSKNESSSSSSASGGASSAVDKETTDRLETNKEQVDEALETHKQQLNTTLATNKEELEKELGVHKEWMDQKTGELNTQYAGVKAKVDDLSSTVSAHAAWSKEFEGKTEAWHSELVLKANANGEAIAQLRSQYEDRVAELELYVNDELAKAVLKAQYDKDIASITTKVTEQDSLIEAKADKILLEGYVKAEELEAKVSEMETAYATSIVTNEIDAGTGEFGTLIVTGSAAIPHGSFGSFEIGGSALSVCTLTIGEQSIPFFATGDATVDINAFTPDLSNYATRAWVTETFESQSDASQTFIGIQEQVFAVSTARTLTIGGKSCSFYGPSDASFELSDMPGYDDALAAARTEGASSVTLSAAGWRGGSNVVSASNGESVRVDLPAFSVSGGDTFNASHKTTVYFYTGSVSGYLQSKEVDASSVYDDGYADGYAAAKAAVKVTAGISQNGFPAQYYATFSYWAKATIDGEEVGSASGSKSFNVKGAM